MSNKLCLITGVGPGTGTQLVNRFSKGGYKVAMLARNGDRLNQLKNEIANTSVHVCDVADSEQLKSTLEEIKAEYGCPDIVVHNAVGGVLGDFLEVKPEVLEDNFRVNTMALMHLAQLVSPEMIKRGSGAILCTGNTSAYRGKANFAGFAPTKAAQRILAESIARRLGPDGIHVAYIAIDAVIDVPWTREAFSEAPDDFFCQPADIAEECFHIAHQPKSAWSFNVEIRPYREDW